MKIEVTKDGNMVIDLRVLVDAMSKDVRDELLKHLCADELLFGAVVDQLASGAYFEDWWFDSKTVTEWRARLIELMPDVTRALVRSLIHDRDSAEAEKKRLNDWAYRLWHAWPDSHWRARPERPDWVPTEWVSEKKLDAVLAGDENP